MNKRTLVLTAIVLYLVAVPLVILLVGAVSTGQPGRPGPLSVSRFAEVLSDPRSYRLLGTSATYSLGSTITGFVIGAPVAWLVHRTDMPFKGFVTLLILFPLFLPAVLTAVAWLLLLDGRIGIINTSLMAVLGLETAPFDIYSLGGMIWVRGLDNVPLVYLWMTPAFMAMDPSLEEAGAMAGSSPARVIRSITLPMMRPALAATFLISFVLGLENLSVPILIGIPARVHVFSSEIYLATSRFPSDIHTASVYSVILLTITVGLMLYYRKLTEHSERYATVRGRNYRPIKLSLGRARTPVTVVMLVALLIVSGLPLLVLIWSSIAPYIQPPSAAALGTATAQWYESLLSDQRAMRGLLNTTILGIATCLVVMGLSIIIGWTLVRTRGKLRNLLDFAAYLPIAVPGVVLGLSLMWLYLTVPIPVYGTLWILGIAFVTKFLPYGVLIGQAGFAQLHPELEEAAQVAGSGWTKQLRTISIPLLGPTLVGGMIYIFLRAFQELPAALILSSFGNEPYSVVSYLMWTGGEASKTAAYGVVAIGIMSIAIMAARRFEARSVLE